MKRNYLLLFLTSLLLLTFSGCRSDKGQDVIEDGKISIELIMPENTSVDGIKGSIAYYWHKDLTLHLTISQEGKESKTIALSPESIPAEGKKVHFGLVLDHDDFDLTTPVEVHGLVAIGKDDAIRVGGGKLFEPNGFGNLLPYDILSVLNQPLLLQKTTITPENHKCELTATLKPQGQLIFLQVHNGSDKALLPKTIEFTSDEEVFLNENGSFSASKGDFEGLLSRKSINFSFPKDERLTPDLASNYIVWIPSNKLSSIGLNISLMTPNGADIVIESPTPSSVSSMLPLIYISLSDDGDIEVGDEPIVEEADTSEGGDPYFTMNDIDFWVGEGENRAALVIEWHDGKQPDALVWGYRWDGEKTGFDMVMAILAADPRLSMVIGKAFGGLDVIGGIGYQFKITKPRAYVILKDEKLANDGNGITYVDNAKDFDNYTFSDPAAHWKNGWYNNGYWVYYTKDKRLDSWSYSQVVYSLRDLEDGCWDGWSFQDGMDSTSGRPHGNRFTPAPLPSQEVVTK